VALLVLHSASHLTERYSVHILPVPPAGIELVTALKENSINFAVSRPNIIWTINLLVVSFDPFYLPGVSTCTLCKWHGDSVVGAFARQRAAKPRDRGSISNWVRSFTVLRNVKTRSEGPPRCGLFLRCQKRPEHLVPRLWMSVAIPLIRHTPSWRGLGQYVSLFLLSGFYGRNMLFWRMMQKVQGLSAASPRRCTYKAGDTLSSRHVTSCDVTVGDTLSSRHVSSSDGKAGDIITLRELMWCYGRGHYPHVTWTHVMLRLGTHCHDVTWAHVMLRPGTLLTLRELMSC